MPRPSPAELLTDKVVHVCVDCQNLFAGDTEWHTPWLPRVLPNIAAMVEARPDGTIFTRFIPADKPGDGVGTWKDYYERWADLTLERLEPGMVELLPELARYVPPAETIDKRVYSPWLDPALDRSLRRRGAETVVVTGGETDVCVLATVLGAVDRGYRIIVVRDALCSSSDSTHDAMMTLYNERYGHQVNVVETDEVLAVWGRP